MTRSKVALFLFLFFCCCFLRVHAQERVVAIVDVTVVPMDRERLVEHQTVIVQEGRITDLGPSRSVRVPSSAQRIDGRGKFLMPGLTDMHVHFVREALRESDTASANAAGPQPGIPASASTDHELENRAYALMFLVNGVTTVRNMWGSEIIDTLAKEINSGCYSAPIPMKIGTLPG